MKLVGDISEQIRGVAYSKDEARSTPAQGYAPILRANNIGEYGLSFDELVYVPEHRISRKQRLMEGDVIVATSSGSITVVGKAAPLVNEFKGSFGAFCKVLRPDRKLVEPSYFAHFFKTRHYRQIVSRLATGININNLKNEHLASLTIPLPPLDEQVRITAILDKAEALRRKRRCATALLGGLKQVIFNNMFGPMDDLEGRGDLVRFGDIAREGIIGLVRPAAELTDSAVGIPYVRMDAISPDGRLSLSPIRRTICSLAEKTKFELNPGDFLFNTRNSKELVGKSAVYDGPPGYVYNNNILRVRFQKDIDPLYIQAFFQTSAAKRGLEARKSGTTSVFAIYQRSLYDLPIVIPSANAQEVFGRRIRHVERILTRFDSHRSNTDSLFASLQHKIFAGQD